MAERMVKTVKPELKKAEQTATDHHLALKNTPVTGMEFSPAQILMGRVLRSILPSSSTVLQPQILSTKKSCVILCMCPLCYWRSNQQLADTVQV
uniref:Uncharacterized protein n=1 Tax=Salmo trutta TaxID=8032 RepID=A0A673XFK5_SALTR